MSKAKKEKWFLSTEDIEWLSKVKEAKEKNDGNSHIECDRGFPPS